MTDELNIDLQSYGSYMREPCVLSPIKLEHVVPLYERGKHPVVYERGSKLYNTLALDDFTVLTQRTKNSMMLYSIAKMLPDDVAIAGGSVLSAISNADINDIDLWICTKDEVKASNAFKSMYNLISNNPNNDPFLSGYAPNISLDDMLQSEATCRGVRFVHFNSDSPGLRPMQIIKMMWFEDEQHVIDCFDFTVTQFALTNKSFIFNPVSMFDVLNKRIVMHKSLAPSQMLRRVVKYAGKGYTVSHKQMAVIIECIKNNTDDVPSYDK